MKLKGFMEQFLQYESLVFGNMKTDEMIQQMIPKDAFIVDERKIPSSLLDNMLIEHAHQMGFPDDKIFIIREIQESFMTDGTSYFEYVQGSLCHETSDEFIDRYAKLGIYPYWMESERIEKKK